MAEQILQRLRKNMKKSHKNPCSWIPLPRGRGLGDTGILGQQGTRQEEAGMNRAPALPNHLDTGCTLESAMDLSHRVPTQIPNQPGRSWGAPVPPGGALGSVDTKKGLHCRCPHPCSRPKFPHPAPERADALCSGTRRCESHVLLHLSITAPALIP